MTTDTPSAFPRLIPSPRSLIIWLTGVASGLAAIGLGALVVIEGGLFNATASTPHNPLVALAAHTAFIRSVQVRAAGIRAPARFTAAQVRAGLADYNATCTACHGAPGMPRWSWANAMTPSPPYLSDVARRWRPRELFWILGQGVKMTGMPAWGESRSDAQLWSLVAFLEAMPLLKPADYARMQPMAPSQAALEGGSKPKPETGGAAEPLRGDR
jgi:mono/diheme cytochrome c family protein